MHIPDCSAWDTYRKHGDESKPFQSVQLGDVIQDSRKYMFVQPGSFSCF